MNGTQESTEAARDQAEANVSVVSYVQCYSAHEIESQAGTVAVQAEANAGIALCILLPRFLKDCRRAVHLQETSRRQPKHDMH